MPASVCQSVAVEGKARAVGIDLELFEAEPRELAVDGTRRRRAGAPEPVRERARARRNLPFPARDIEHGAAENAAGRHIDRDRAGERNAKPGELLKLRSDEGELDQIKPGEADGGAAHLALAVVEQLHLQMGLQVPHLQLCREVPEDRGVVEIEREVGARRGPGEIGCLVDQDDGGIAQADPLQPRHRVVLAGRVEQIVDQGIGRVASSATPASSLPARRTCPSASRTRARLSPISSIDVGAIVPLNRAAPLSPSDAAGTAARVVPLASAIRRSVKWTSSASPQPGQTRTVSSNSK